MENLTFSNWFPHKVRASNTSPLELNKKLLQEKMSALKRLDDERSILLPIVAAYKTVVEDLERKASPKVSLSAIPGSSMSKEEEQKRKQQAVDLMTEKDEVHVRELALLWNVTPEGAGKWMTSRMQYWGESCPWTIGKHQRVFRLRQ
jgi:hypothetical protein